uniref:Ubiquitin carboxyl-terminal hydrolase n=1 Tax=Globodera rostochiensis TaxID=31243 RepID=A0A914IAW4_GLORO
MFDIEMNIDTDAYKLFHSYLSEQKLYLKGPERAELVFKDECLYCFDTPFSTGGLFVSLHTFVGVCSQHIKLVAEKTSSRIFLNIQKFVELSEEPKDKKPCLKLDKEQQQIKTEYSLRIYPLFTVPLPITEGAEAGIPRICEEIIAHVSAELQQRLNSGISEWDGEERTVAKAAEDLVQLNYDGNGHAKAHFESTGFPLVVKLGTIENEDGDIYSYDEDAPVRDPWLAQHLAHFGLDINKFRKTEKTTLELELDANLKHEFSTIQEEGLQLVSVAGPGFTGLINLGSSCYINSALQVLLIVPDFACVFTEEFLLGKQPAEINEDFTAQLAKMGLKRSVAFVRQRFGELWGEDILNFQLQSSRTWRNMFAIFTRFVDELSNCVRYSFRTDTILSVAIPVDLIKESNIVVNGVKRKSVTLEGCLTAAFEEEFIDDYLSPVLRVKGRAKQEQRMGSFPDFLFLQLRRFTFDGTRGMRKLDVDVHFPDELDLSAFYSTGELQPGEQGLPEDADETSSTLSTNKPTCSEPNQKIVNELLLMGFTENAAKKATLFTKNESLESATNWILQHMDDSDLNDPHPVLSKQSVPPSSSSNQGQPTHKQETRNGSGRYRLRAFISHMGSSPHSGHYVAHVKAENGKWHIFNDEKVAESQHPPKTLGDCVISLKRVKRSFFALLWSFNCFKSN